MTPDHLLDPWRHALRHGPASVAQGADHAVQAWAAFHTGRHLPVIDDPLALWWHQCVDTRAMARELPPLPPAITQLRPPLAAWLHQLAQADRTPQPLDHSDPISLETHRIFATVSCDVDLLRDLTPSDGLIGARAKYALGQQTASLSLLRDALQALHRLGDAIYVRKTLHAIAELALKRQRPAEALPLLHRAIQIDKRLDDTGAMLEDCALLDRIFTALGREEPRLSALPQWLHAAERGNKASLAAWIMSLIAHTQEATYRHKEALESWKEAARRSSIAQDTHAMIDDLLAARRLALVHANAQAVREIEAELLAVDPHFTNRLPPSI